MWRSFLLLFVFADTTLAQFPTFVVETTDEQPRVGSIRALKTDGSLRLKNDRLVEVIGDTLVALHQQGQSLLPYPVGSHVVLTNGDRIPTKKPRLIGEDLYVNHPYLSKGRDTKIGIGYLSLIWWQAPAKEANPERFARQLARESRSKDKLILVNGDVLDGALIRLDGEQLYFQARDREVKLDVTRVACLAFSTQLAEAVPTKGRYTRAVLANPSGADSTRLALIDVVCEDAVFLRAKTLLGADVYVPLKQVLALDVIDGPADFLSDRKPNAYEFVPYTSLKWELATDASLSGNTLRLESSNYDKGLGMHAHSKVTYPLDGKYRHFTARVGLDPFAGRRGEVQVRVLADGKSLPLPRNGILRFADGAMDLRLDISSAKELTLEVDFASRGNVQARVNWANPRLLE